MKFKIQILLIKKFIEFTMGDGENIFNEWVDKRLAVGSALFILYFIHYTFLLFGILGRCNFESLEFIQKRIFTYGIAGTLILIKIFSKRCYR